MTSVDTSQTIHASGSFYVQKDAVSRGDLEYKRGIFYSYLGMVDVFTDCNGSITLTTVIGGVQYNRFITGGNSSNRALSIHAGKFLRHLNSKINGYV